MLPTARGEIKPRKTYGTRSTWLARGFSFVKHQYFCNFCIFLKALAKDLENEKPKAGEDGWLVSMAKDMEEELRPSGDTMIANSGDLSSRRSSQGGSSQGSQGNSNRIGGSSGETSSTLRNVSGGQTSSQTFSQKLSQSEDNKSSESQTKVSQSQENSQPSSQPSSIDVLATQAVSSQLFALAAADLQVKNSQPVE